MKTRRTQGASLIEVLLVMGVSALLVGGGAAHVQSLRQASDLTSRRRDALQNARVAFDRLARKLRSAKQIAAITASTNTLGSITITDFSDVNHVFRRVGTELRYGVLAATDLLASGIESFTLQGYSPTGTVAYTKPYLIDAVQVSLVATIPGSTQTLSLSTRVRLCREIPYNQVRSTTSNASTYATTLGSGLTNYSKAYGAQNSTWAILNTSTGGRYSGFPIGSETGTVKQMYAGLRMNYTAGALRVIIRYDSTVLLDRSYWYADLDDVLGTAVWWYFDITALRPSWTEQDIDNLSIEVSDPQGSYTYIRFDCFAIRAFFDDLPTTFFWADRQGGSVCPKQWDNPDYAYGEANDTYATGNWPEQDWQSFRVPVSNSAEELFAVHVCIHGYLTADPGSGDIEARHNKASESLTTGVDHRVLPAQLAGYVWPENKSYILVDVTNDRSWTWANLDGREIRIHLNPNGTATCSLKADAVGWRATSFGTEKGVRIWSEP